MLDGCMYGTERTIFKTEDITNKCKFELGAEIEWAYTNTQGEIRQCTSKNKHIGIWAKGTVVADYETYFIVQSPKGFRYCLDKVDIATKQIVVKGFKPNIKKGFAVNYRI
jgi:hypothetical protein